ncbi:isochorismate synthase [Christiangramia gaetbulicola]|uniref:Isochorismate synthase n=1 Tax=Christiangramia gaetbulicola TaxID=703340 RepID=A0A2T6AFH8_9FLAO|nr:chorismate-binding protein [Christiangramia gaetbulicola]PTX42561.1 isochorismate synthase [Christiangramia gaetbulicola]
MIDQKDFFRKLEGNFGENKPCVAYSKPGENIVKALLQLDNENYQVQDLSESGFVFAPFDPENDSYLIPAEKSERLEFDIQLEEDGAIPSDEENIDSVDFEYMEEDQKRHENLVQKGIDEVKEGNFKKVVLSRSEQVEVLDPDPIRIFKKLLKKYPNAMVYLWFHPQTGFWFGATPETLLRVERTKFNTMALAGTQLYKGETDVEWESKEVEEQLFVTDYILESLENLEGVENIKTSRPYSAKAGNLLHICTDIFGYLKDPENLKDLIETIHPTPAVCGLPRQEALDFILENEDHSREFYSGYLGELNLKTEQKRNSNQRNQENQQFASISKQTELFVNLRCMKLKDGNARIYVGGGITKDSNAADEWMETVNKSQTMKAVLVK